MSGDAFRFDRADTEDPENWSDLKVMHRACFPYDVMPAPTGFWWIVRSNDEEERQLGFTAVWKSVLIEKAGYLGRMGVAPAARGRGLQKAMITFCEDFGRQQGWSLIVTDTVWLNIHSNNNFASCGWQMFWPQEGEWASDHALYWRKHLIESAP